ncbi:MAG TPA: HAD-IIA family hydrolase [Opitutales bacterium]|nr:HAD-IIA family hydrolase [Opitutales bacterium]
MSTQQLKEIRHIALDMDGTIYSGGTLFPFTRRFLARLDELGIGYTFFTNNSSKSVRDYITHLARFGMEVGSDQMYTSTLSTIAYLRREYPNSERIFIVGTKSMQREMEEAGFSICDEDPELVVVGFDPNLDFSQLCRAGYWIEQGKPFIATHPDRICPTDQPTLLIDCGAICAALTSATGRAPDAVLGKPHRIMMEEILKKHDLQPRELAVVGDRIYTDVAMAHAVGATGVLVLTGEGTREEGEAADPRPHLILESIEALGDAIARAQAG